ncbi:MAG: hypothetical protein WCI49_08835 [Ferruginibacter sp.]
MKKWFFIFIAICTISLLASCHKEDSPAATNFDGNIKIRMSETVDSTKRVLTLTCFTEKIYGCSNLSIQTSHTITSGKITINFIKIAESYICLTSLGPAYTIINFDKIPIGVYELELNFGNSKVAGQLNVSTGSFVASVPVQTKVQFINPDLKRVPDNTIFGTVHYHAAGTATLVQQFIDSLQYFGATATVYPQGDYGQFQIEAGGSIKQTQDPGYYFTRYYIFNYTGNNNLLKNLVQRYGNNYPSELLITLNSTRGQVFYSWVK